MKARIIVRTNGGWTVNIVEVEISDFCPICGEKRGEPKNYNFYENDESFSCDTWNNPCGHIDFYKDVLEEAKKIYEKGSCCTAAEPERHTSAGKD